MAPDELWQASATTLRRWLDDGEVSSEEIVRASIARIAALDRHTNAFMSVDEAGALDAARAADRARRRGDALGPLHGLPVSIKDVIATRGLRTTYGSRLYAQHVPSDEPEAVSRVRSAGGIVLGKTTTSEFAHKALTDSPLHGITRSPWSLAHSSGGSSGGAGVAAAMGFAPLNVCTDGAGSARIPAACCGVVGLKPTLGAIPNEDAPDLFGLQVIGLITRTVDDLALLYRTLCGPCARDPLSLRAPAPSVFGRGLASLEGLRVGWLPRIGNALVDARVLAAAKSLLADLEAAGARVSESPTIDWALDAWRTLLRAQQAHRFGHLPAPSLELLDASMRQCIAEGRAQTAAELQAALQERTALYRRMQSLFADADVLASPVVSTPAVAATQAADAPVVVEGREAGTLRNAWYSYAIPINAGGHPAIAVPCGITGDGLPISLQLVAPWHGEALLLDVAAVIERMRPWRGRWPPLAFAGRDIDTIEAVPARSTEMRRHGAPIFRGASK